jgi:hypothetical protein
VTDERLFWKVKSVTLILVPNKGLLNCIVNVPNADTEYASIVGSIVFGV